MINSAISRDVKKRSCSVRLSHRTRWLWIDCRSATSTRPDIISGGRLSVLTRNRSPAGRRGSTTHRLYTAVSATPKLMMSSRSPAAAAGVWMLLTMIFRPHPAACRLSAQWWCAIPTKPRYLSTIVTWRYQYLRRPHITIYLNKWSCANKWVSKQIF